jgi:hypothetical protein
MAVAVGEKVVTQFVNDRVAMYHGDSCEVIRGIPSDSVHYSIFSPPFSDLFCYTALPQDVGNVGSDDEFFAHFDFLIGELYRVIKPGRLLSFHCMNMPRAKGKHGFIGIYDFRGDLIRAFQKHGFIYHSEVCVWKDPVTAMQRTKALGLLHKQLRKDSAMSRQGIADYVVTMRKPGVNDEPVWHYGSEKEAKTEKLKADGVNEEEATLKASSVEITDDDKDKVFTVDMWQRYASPVWMDIDQTRVLPFREARTDDDTKHVCVLQLDVIERCIDLWTNPGDTVLTPFMGVGSEVHTAVMRKRRGVGIELKDSYYQQALKNVADALRISNQKDLFSEVE